MFYQRRSLFNILKDGTLLYLRYWGHLTRPLVYPVLAQFVGIGLWLGLTYGIVDWMTNTMGHINLWLLWGGFILANIPGMWLFFDGFWRYLIWVSALNLMIRELVETGRCDESHPYYIRIRHRAVDYTLIWTFLFGLVFIPIGLGMIPVTFLPSGQDVVGLGVLLGVAIAGIGLVLAGILMVFFSLVFQAFSFTPGSAGASLFRSLDLVAQGFWKTLVVVSIALVTTQWVLPMAFTDVSDAAGLTHLMSFPIHEALDYFVREYETTIQSFNDPLLSRVFTDLSAGTAMHAENLMRAIILIVVSAWLLPLGTCWFALLYGDLKTRLDASKTLTPTPERQEATV